MRIKIEQKWWTLGTKIAAKTIDKLIYRPLGGITGSGRVEKGRIDTLINPSPTNIN